MFAKDETLISRLAAKFKETEFTDDAEMTRYALTNIDMLKMRLELLKEQGKSVSQSGAIDEN